MVLLVKVLTKICISISVAGRKMRIDRLLCCHGAMPYYFSRLASDSYKLSRAGSRRPVARLLFFAPPAKPCGDAPRLKKRSSGLRRMQPFSKLCAVEPPSCYNTGCVSELAAASQVRRRHHLPEWARSSREREKRQQTPVTKKGCPSIQILAALGEDCDYCRQSKKRGSRILMLCFPRSEILL